MGMYKTAGEQMFVILPIFLFLLNIIFQKAYLSYIEFSFWWIFLFLIYPLAHILQFKINTKLTNHIYNVVILTFIYQLVFLILRLSEILIELFFDIVIKRNLILLLSFIILVVGYSCSKWIMIKQKKFTSSKITTPLRIIQISDVHAFGALSTRLIFKIVKKIKTQNPDIVVITGDLLDYYGVPAKETLNPFDELDCPIYYVYGNHENLLLKTYAEELINNSKIIPLINESIKFRNLQIVGIDDDIDEKMLDRVDKQKLDKKLYSVLLQHKPHNVENNSEKGFDLMLSGHTHAGQFFPLNLIFKLVGKYVAGYYLVKNMHLYVSRGTGTNSFPFKIGVGNELTVIDLLPHMPGDDQK